MNERIKELYTQALETKFDYRGGANVKPGEYYSNYKTVLNAEKFAELIVKECAEVCKSATKEGQPLHLVSIGYADRIKQHFGVKE